MVKTEQIIEGLKILNRYEHSICAYDNRLLIYVKFNNFLNLDEQNQLKAMDWKLDEDDDGYWRSCWSIDV